MHYEVYIDIVFLTNLLMDYILLSAVGRIFGCKRSRRRTLAGAVLGAAISCLFLYIRTESFLPAYMLIHGACALGMLIVGCGLKKGSLLLKAALSLYLAAFLCGGIWEVLGTEHLTGKTFLLFAGITWLVLCAGTYLSDSLKIRRKAIYPVTITHNGKDCFFYGFYDSGNLLTDPVTGKPVSVICTQSLPKILSFEMTEQLKHFKEDPEKLQRTKLVQLHPHFISFQSIGNGDGMMLAVTLEELCIQTSAEVIRIKEPVFACALETSAFGKEYEILLNSRLL